MRKITVRLKLTFLICSLLIGVLWAADPTGRVAGTVSDPSGAAVVGAVVVVTNPNTGLTRKATTAADGGFVFPLLPVGSYDLHTQAAGFQGYEQRGIDVQADQASTVPVVC